MSRYLTSKIVYYSMKRKKSLTKTQYEECFAKTLVYVAQILVGAFFIAVFISVFYFT